MPRTRTKSAWPSAKPRACEKASGWPAGRRPAPGAVHEDGHAGGLGEGREIGRRVVPVDAAARHDDGPLGLRQADRRASGPTPDRARAAGDGHSRSGWARSRSSTMVISRSTGISTKTGPGPAGQRGADGRREHLGDLPRLGHRPRALGDGLRRSTCSTSWSEPEPAQTERRRAADQEQRAPRRVGVGDARDRVGHARPRRDHGHADVARQPRVGVARVRRRLLVAHVHHLDALGDAAVVDRQDVPAAEREDVADARLLERPRHQVPAVQIRHRSLPAVSYQNFSHLTLFLSMPFLTRASRTALTVSPPPQT